jgi:hypothetical protein
LKPKEFNIYDDRANIVQAEYNLYDWLIEIYDIFDEFTVERTLKRVDAYYIPDIGYFEDITFILNDEEYHLRDYYRHNDTIMIPNSTSDESKTLTINHMIDSDDRYDQRIYQFILADEHDMNIQYSSRIDIPQNNPFEIKKYVNEDIHIHGNDNDNDDNGNDNSNIICNDYITVGVDSSIQYSSVQINNISLNNITNYMEFLSSLAESEILGVYKNNVNSNDIVTSSDFEEYSHVNSTIPITIKYRIQTEKTLNDESIITLSKDEIVTFDSNICILKDMNNEHGNRICSRDFDFEKNMYKTFLIDTDLMNTKFSTNNWLYSMKKITSNDFKVSPYIHIQDLKLKMMTTSDKVANLSEYLQPVIIKYYIQWINDKSMNLIINSNNFGFSDISAFINNTEYKLQKITDNLFSLDYNNIIDNVLEIYSSGSRFKMIIQLL